MAAKKIVTAKPLKTAVVKVTNAKATPKPNPNTNPKEYKKWFDAKKKAADEARKKLPAEKKEREKRKNDAIEGKNNFYW